MQNVWKRHDRTWQEPVLAAISPSLYMCLSGYVLVVGNDCSSLMCRINGSSDSRMLALRACGLWGGERLRWKLLGPNLAGSVWSRRLCSEEAFLGWLLGRTQPSWLWCGNLDFHAASEEGGGGRSAAWEAPSDEHASCLLWTVPACFGVSSPHFPGKEHYIKLWLKSPSFKSSCWSPLLV